MWALYSLVLLFGLVYLLVSVGLPALSGWPDEPYRSDVFDALWFAIEEDDRGDSL